MKHLVFTVAVLLLPPTLEAQESTYPETFVVAQNRTPDDVVASLEYEGYIVGRISRTLLGRVQITAQNESHERRIVMSRTTGEVLSDSITTVFDEQGNPTNGKPRLGVSGRVTFGVNID